MYQKQKKLKDTLKEYYFQDFISFIHDKDEENLSGGGCEDSELGKNKVNSKDAETPLKASKMCRICLYENCEPNDHFLSPCSCSGTMKHIHIRCLQKWLKSKLHVKVNGPSTAIHWKSFECELCKTLFPGQIKIKKDF